MARYVNLDDIVKFIKENGYVYANTLERFPTANVVPLIRCKDCVYWQKLSINDTGFLICPASGMDVTENDFCSYGEKTYGEADEQH